MAETEAKQKTYTEEKKMEILWDAARTGVKKASEEHDCTQSNIYRWGYERPELWEGLKARLRPAVEMDAYELMSICAAELKSRLEADPTSFKNGELIGLMREGYSIFERFARIDQLKTSVNDLLQEIMKGNDKILTELFKSLKGMPPKEFDEFVERFKTGVFTDTSGSPKPDDGVVPDGD